MSLRADLRRPLAGIVDVVVIGAGHSGLAMSHARSLRLLTPNWMSRLPGHGYQGGDPGRSETVT